MSERYRTPARPLRAVTEELVRGGVRDVVVCPGSRSTPMALAVAAAPQLRTWVHLDERAGAFFALGLAKAARRPAAVLATSGTAVVNFAPAVTEARYGRVPLILLTANRPPELQGIGSPQTIDQVELYGRTAKWFVELPVPEDSDEVEAEVRGAVSRALDAAVALPAGPVQVDLPFREPLLPDGPLVLDAALDEDRSEPLPAPAAEDVRRTMEALAGSRRPLIVCGPADEPGLPAALAPLALAVGAPLLADGLAGLRNGPHPHDAVVAHHDTLLQHEGFRRRFQPDLVLRFGGVPTSKVLGQLLDGLEVRQLLIDDAHGWNRPPATAVIEAGAVPFVSALSDSLEGPSSALDGEWLPRWRAADDAAAAALDDWFAALDEPFEGSVPRALDAVLPDGTLVLVGNSMPVRDLETFLPASDRVRRWLGNRGVNGIDGMLSTALGAAAGQDAPVAVVLGDLSLLHDLTALHAASRLGSDLTVVLLNNDGGGIFSFLSQAQADLPEAGLPANYERLFGTPHDTDFGPLTTALGARHQLVDQTGLAESLAVAVGRAGVDVLELRTDRARNVTLHRAALAAVARAAEELR